MAYIVLCFVLFFYGYEFFFLALAAWAAPGVGQILKRGAGRYVLLRVALFRVVCILAWAFELCHNRRFFSLTS